MYTGYRTSLPVKALAGGAIAIVAAVRPGSARRYRVGTEVTGPDPAESAVAGRKAGAGREPGSDRRESHICDRPTANTSLPVAVSKTPREPSRLRRSTSPRPARSLKLSDRSAGLAAAAAS